jgi:glycolate oxidase iron-sulfur subunit
MQTHLPQEFLETPQGAEADRILRTCVHCGFCNAACPTYRIFGDERDGPRGRIYLIKRMLEGGPVSESTRLHLDRCLTCRACEVACPSGVEFDRLIEIGREHMESILERPRNERMLRRMLAAILDNPERLRWCLRLASYLRGLLPRRLVAALPRATTTKRPAQWPPARHARRVLVLDGCIQNVTHSQIDIAAARLLDRAGISAIRVAGSGCCGAAAHHLGAAKNAIEAMRRNIDAWWPHIEGGAEAVLASSSACSVMLRDYGRLLDGDPDYREKAARISGMVREMTDLISELPAPDRASHRAMRVAFHAPCSLQNGLRRHRAVEGLLRLRGFELVPVRDAQACCGAAGTYAIFQPEISERLRSEKLQALERDAPAVIATANIGCLIHLEKQASVPVKHWIELLDEKG